MKLLRIVLLGLAAIVFAALGWRVGTDRPRRGPPAVAIDAPVAPAPRVAPTPPAVPAPPRPVASAQAPGAASPSPAVSGGEGEGTMSPETAHQRIEAILRTAPDLAGAFDLLRAEFPLPADRSLAAAAEALRTTGDAPSPDDVFAATMRELRQSAGVLAAKAGAEALAAVFDMKAAMLADLEQADPRICADYLFGGTSPEFADFAAGHRALIAKAALANVQAMADGRTRQAAWDPPSPEDFKLIETALAARGLTADEIGALLDGKASATPLTDAQLCSNSRTYLDVLRAMPLDARNRVYGLAAELLARS